MTLVQRVFIEKRWAITVVLVSVVIDMALYGLAVLPWSVALANAQQRAVTATAALTVAERALAVARTTLGGKLEADRELQTFYQETLPADLSDARGITFARLEEAASQNNLVMERRSSSTEHQEGSRLARLQMIMFLKGDYRDMRSFVSDLESGDDFIVIEEIALSQDNISENTETLTLGLATYFWTDEDENSF
jgi:Tfp pilus assembly protein PilO